MRAGRHLLVGALLAAFCAQSFFASRLKSPAFDEPAHLAAGVSYLTTGIIHLNLQHPPLLKEWSAMAAMVAGARWPQTAEARQALSGPPVPWLDWKIGSAIIAAAGTDRVMFWARLPMIGIAALLGLAIYLWGRRILGEAAALGALFLYAFDPTAIAHSYLVTTDIGLAAFTVLFLMALWNYVERPTRWGLLGCGLALGAALGAKYSAVLLLPVALALLLAARGRRATGPFLAMCAVAFAVVEAVFLWGSPMLYLEGIRRVNADHDPRYLAFLGGVFRHRFPTYFAVAYVLKEPLASILLAELGLAAVLAGKASAKLARLFLLLPPAVLLAAYSAKAENLGIRYMLPALPFAWLLGGAGLAWLFRSPRRWVRAVGVALCLWTALAAAGIYPDHLSYFNESACLATSPRQIGLDGGTRCGPAWLDDSNVDWGQGMRQLRGWLAARGIDQPVHMAYFGTFPPEHYGIRYTHMDPLAPPVPGIYVVSAHLLPRFKTAGSWIGKAVPVAIVGHALYVFKF